MSLTAFKRRIQTGVVVHIENIKYPELTRTRPVIKAQGSGFVTEATRADGSTVQSWIYWPSAAETTIGSDGSVSFIDYNTSLPWLKLSVVES